MTFALFLRSLQWQFIGRVIRLIPKRWRTDSHDRYVLEQVIFRDLFIRKRYSMILFAGCDSYTRWYPALFERFSNLTFATAEPEEWKKKYGSRKFHWVGRFEDLKALPEQKESYDLVILNGIFGFGTDTSAAKAMTLETAYRLLKPAGTLLIGFNDRSGNSRFIPAQTEAFGFSPAPIPGMEVSDYLSRGENCHRYVCFVKTKIPKTIHS